MPMRNARNALVVVSVILAVLWIVQIVNYFDSYRLSYDYSIQPRVAVDLPHVLSAPFLHWSWSHLEGNSLPLVVLGFVAGYRDMRAFVWVTLVVVLTSGLLTWSIAAGGSESAGASGVIFGWFGYVIVRGFFNHNKADVIVGLVVMLYYLPIFTLLLPAPHLGYQDHIGGLIGGLGCGWAFRSRTGADAAERGSDFMKGQAAVPGTGRPPVPKVEQELAE
ncbi:MAG TPA: rhomboid family intramembrane serine protease, partial [Acidimicrobiales bacterium]|nr:rhomboid family intramembrane serine protease [Acidimicrobiales bacterium]